MDNCLDNCSIGRGILTAVVAILALVWNSLYVVEPTEVGIDLNLIWYTLGDDLDSGRQPLGLGHRVIHFDTKLVTVDFSSSRTDSEKTWGGDDIRARTADGLEVQLEVSFMYHFTQQKIKEVYAKFGEGYAPIINLMAIDAVTRESTKYNASTFFANRTTISDEMKENLSDVFEQKAFCVLDLFQLRSVSLPSLYETEIQATEVAKQELQKAKAERDNQLVVGETDVAKATRTAQKIGLEANATAETINIDNVAYVAQFTLTQQLQAEGFAGINAVFNESETHLLEYMDIRALRDHPSAKSVVSIPMKQ